MAETTTTTKKKKPKIYNVDNMEVCEGSPDGVYQTYFAVVKGEEIGDMDLPFNIPKIYLNKLPEGEVIV